MSLVAVPLNIIRDTTISADYKAVYFTLWIRSRWSHEVTGLTKVAIGKLLGFHEDRVSKVIGGLNEKGLVVTTRHGRKGNKYTLPEKIDWSPEPGNFTLLERRVFFNKRLPYQARILHATVKSFCYKDKPAKLHLDFLSALTAWSHRTLSRYLLLLRKIGLLRVVRRKFLSNMYYTASTIKHFRYKAARHCFSVPAAEKQNTRVVGGRTYTISNNPVDRMLAESRQERIAQQVYREMLPGVMK